MAKLVSVSYMTCPVATLEVTLDLGHDENVEHALRFIGFGPPDQNAPIRRGNVKIKLPGNETLYCDEAELTGFTRIGSPQNWWTVVLAVNTKNVRYEYVPPKPRRKGCPKAATKACGNAE